MRSKTWEGLQKKGELHRVTPDKNPSVEKLREIASTLKVDKPIDIRKIPSE